MSRLIVVSNRVAPVNAKSASAGGLAVALLTALKRLGGVWLGWSGEVVPNASREPHVFDAGRLTYATLDLTERDYEEYYNGFANRTLWPLFHFRLDLTDFDRRAYAGYLRVNALFARTLKKILEPGDLVWVHDYHLIPLGEELRRLGVDHPLGFFLHTPLPPPELLLTLPGSEHLVRALCAYDVVGFQTATDQAAFHNYIVREAGGNVRSGGVVRAYGRTLRSGVFPVGIDVEAMESHAKHAVKARPAKRLHDSLYQRDLIIGVDRLDYSKGLLERFLAYERFLEMYPEQRNHVIYMQIATATRADVPEYLEIRRALEGAAGHINGRFAEFDWVPIRYLGRSVNHRTLAGFFRLSRIGLVTPLRDGMNLVAKEYVASQNPEDPGVLVLSRFAGAAQELDAALIVNPFDVVEVAEAVEHGLRMDLAERRERWSAMMSVLRRNTLSDWRDSFLDSLRDRALAA